MMTRLHPEPFHIDIPQEKLDDLRDRLGRTRFPDAVEGAGWDYGCDLDFLRRFVAYWRDRFDWRAQEAALNAVPQFRAVIQGEGVHFVHVRGEGGRRVPLLLANGWPSCFVELLALVPLLTKEKNGLSFDVVIPSLPGYGFSDRPRRPGMNLSAVADLWVSLMRGLGYERFLAHGTDMSNGVTQRLCAAYPERLIGVHGVNVYWEFPRPDDPTEEEKEFFRTVDAWKAQESAYMQLHFTKPQTLAFGLNDSPAGLAAWIVEKYRAWSDCGGDVEKAFSLDALATVLTIYWVTETIGSSMRLYYEAQRDEGLSQPPRKNRVPYSISLFPRDISPAPRAWAERWINVKRWTVMPRGGHFPAFEVPELLAGEIRAFAEGITEI
ncbi:MAG: epoxide hydrolase family protein [Rhizomicrobium sp.]